MSVLASYAQHLLKIDAQAIILESGQPLRARFADGERVASQPVEAGALVAAVMEAVPHEMTSTVQRGRPIRFALDEENVQFQVDVDPSAPTGWRVTLTRRGSSRFLRPVDPHEIEFTPDGPPVKRRTMMAHLSQPPRKESPQPVPRAEASIPPAASVPRIAEPSIAPRNSSMPPRHDPTHAVGSLRLERLVQRMVLRSVRTVHLVEGAPTLARGGEGLVPLDASDPPLEESTIRALLVAIVPPARRDELDALKLLAIEVESAGHRLHATIRSERHSYAISLRRVAGAPPALAALRLPDEVLALAEAPHGLVLLCGDGASLLGHAFVTAVTSQRAARAMVFESTPMFDHGIPGRVAQVAIPTDGRMFAGRLGLLACDDVDVVMIDPWVATDAVIPALDLCASGKLVIAAVPGPDRLDAVARLISVGREYVRRVLPRHVAGIVVVRNVPNERGERMVECSRVLHGNALTSLCDGGIERLELELDLAENAAG